MPDLAALLDQQIAVARRDVEMYTARANGAAGALQSLLQLKALSEQVVEEQPA